MSEIIFGTQEHVAGLSRKALEEDFQWVNDRRMELEGECERLDTENAKLREQIHWLEKGDILHVLTDQEYIDQSERERLMQVSIDALDKENAKLRDLALNCYRMAKAHCTDKDCRTRCSHWPECCEHDSLQHAEPCELAVLACELGIEVVE